MNTRLTIRWMAVVLVAFAALAGVSLAVHPAMRLEARAQSIGYTVGGPCGATIQACINNPIVQAGDRVLIPAGIYTESLTLNRAVSLIGSDAHTTIVYVVSGQRVLTVTGNAITGSTIISGLMLTGGGEGGSGGGIFITGLAQPMLVGLIVSNNHAFHGGGIYADFGSKLRLVDMQILNNTATYCGGAEVIADAVIRDSRFEDNHADNGGGLCGNVSASLTLTNVEFVHNSTLSNGGGVLAGSVNITGSRFENNSATSAYGVGGGGLSAREATIAGTTFISNTAQGSGGGAFVYENATVLDSYFKNNQSLEGGGGGLQVASALTLVHSIFVGNTAFPSFENGSGLGGGAHTGVATLIDNHFERNEAQTGGGLFAGGIQNIVATRFISNIANGSGGGLFSVADLMVTNTLFMENAAIDGGGLFHTGWYGLSPSVRIVNSMLARNVASGSGAGVYLSSPGQSIILHTTIADASLNPKQAIVVFNGTAGITNTIVTSHSIGISQTAGTVYENYNLFFGTTITKTGAINGGTNDVIGDPRFAGPISGDYHILTSSAAIGAGANAGVLADIDNQPRPANRIDIGADEYWAPGALRYIYLPLIRKN